MKAVVYHSYGSPDVLRVEEVAKPIPADDQVLIRIQAASVNPYDWHFMRGTPYFLRLAAGLRKPKVPRLGVDVAGAVESVGRSVTQFKAGDEVFGGCRGSFAEYACAPETALAPKPANLTFEQAASVNIAGMTALQGLRDTGRVTPGQKVLINGAAGGVGTFAVQIAKWLGADVTGVCSTTNAAMVRSIGADRVIDYTREDFTRGSERYDAILDNAGNHSLSAIRRVLNPGGRYVMVGGPASGWMIGPLVGMIEALVLSRFGDQKLGMCMTRPTKEDRMVLHDLLESGKVRPVIDRSYSLTDIADAVRYSEEGHARGKIVITVQRRTDAS